MTTEWTADRIITVHIFFALVILSLLTSCGTSSIKENTIKPDWVDGNSAQYPTSHNIIGQGIYKKIERAKDLARAEIANKFEVSVKEDTSDSQSFSHTKTKDTKEKKPKQSASHTVATSTDKILRSVQILDVWKNPQTLNYHVLAVLSRQKSAAILQQNIARLDDATRTYIGSAAASIDQLEKVAYARLALDTQIERFAYQRSIQIVNLSEQSVPVVWTVTKLNTDFSKLLKRIRIYPVVQRDETDSLLQALSAGIAKAGMTVENSRSADYTMSAALDLDVSDKKKDGWYWAGGALEIELFDKNRNLRGTHRWPIKVSSQDADTINTRVGDELSMILRKNLQSTIINFSKNP